MQYRIKEAIMNKNHIKQMVNKYDDNFNNLLHQRKKRKSLIFEK